MEKLWAAAEGADVSAESLQQWLKRCEPAIPDTEDYPDASDVLSIILAAWEALKVSLGDVSHLTEVLVKTQEAVEVTEVARYSQDDERGPSSTAEIPDYSAYPAVQQHIAYQRWAIAELARSTPAPGLRKKLSVVSARSQFD